MNITEKTLSTLEFDKIRQMLADSCHTAGAAQMALMEVLLTLSSWAITGSNQWRAIDMQADCLRRFDDTGRFWLVCKPDHLGRRMVQMSGFFYTDSETKKPVTQCRMKQMRLDG